MEQSIFLGRRENISHRRGLAYKRSEGWDASSELLFRGGHDSIEHTPYPYPKTIRSPVMPSRAEPEILSGRRHMDLFNLINVPNPTKVRIETRPRTAQEVPLLTVTVSRVIEMEDAAVASESSGTPSIIEKSQLDFANEDPPQTITERSGTEDRVQDGMAYEIPPTRNASTTGFSDLQVSNNQLAKQVVNLQAQVTSEEKIKAAFEEFKKYEDDKVEQRCAKMDARLDKLSVDLDEELYPHMLTAITGRRWVIGYGLRLAVMKCLESSEIRQAFADVVSAGLAKGMSEGLKYGIEHGKADRDLADIKAYDPEANSKLVKALQDLKDLKYPMVDQLERLKDALMELIMASLHLNSDTGKDALNPWAVKEEMLLEDAIVANISRAKKKKKCRVVCHAHGIGSAHHARSDGIHVSAPTVVPQGLAILLVDAATQTEAADKEDEPHPRLQRSISLPPVDNL
ncbi:hypothetical protein Tco_0352435 [Tanacetum coccineum]